ncbi:hypothetical protein [Streptomyces sp. NPDC000618]
MSAVFEAATLEEGAEDWTKVYPALAGASGHGCDVVEGKAVIGGVS